MNCKYLDHHVCIRTNGEYRFCCKSMEPSTDINIKTHTIEQWTKSTKLLNAKQLLSRGIFPDACSSCRIDESLGKVSMRQRPEHYGPGISHLDIRFSNQCNLRCNMCNPSSSSSIMQEHRSLGKTSPWIEIDSTDYNWYSEEAVKQITSISTLREIYLTGGEPFMVKNLDKFINRLDRNIKLRFNTNGTLYNKKLLDILKEFNYVNMCYSIDGVGSVNDYIRYGSKFSEIINNLEIAIDCGFDVSVSPTVQILNVLRMDEYNDYFARYNIKIYENILSHPSYLSLNNSNEKHRQDIKNYSMSEYVNETAMFINSVKTLDKNRAINILDYLPELGQYYDFS